MSETAATQTRTYRVGVFTNLDGSFLAAYLRDPERECCLHTVESDNGHAAKLMAIEEHKARCGGGAR